VTFARRAALSRCTAPPDKDPSHASSACHRPRRRRPDGAPSVALAADLPAKTLRVTGTAAVEPKDGRADSLRTAYRDALNRAADDAKEKAQALAERLGGRLGAVRSIDERSDENGNCDRVAYLPPRAGAAPAPPAPPPRRGGPRPARRRRPVGARAGGRGRGPSPRRRARPRPVPAPFPVFPCQGVATVVVTYDLG